jgi:lauroyl/myristoyl acyltransferase
MHEPIEVADASPAAVRRATQAIAEALEAMIAHAPEQWYTFKPMWPASAAETRELARRAATPEAADA